MKLIKTAQGRGFEHIRQVTQSFINLNVNRKPPHPAMGMTRAEPEGDSQIWGQEVGWGGKGAGTWVCRSVLRMGGTQKEDGVASRRESGNGGRDNGKGRAEGGVPLASPGFSL